MRIGFGAPISGAWATPDNLSRFAVKAEELGYESFWTFQRLLTPTAYPLDPVYQSVLDPITALSYAAALTTRMRLGVAVINFPFVSPAYLAKQASTLALLSGGRFDLGLGSGWQHEEFVASGASTEHRGARLAEYVSVLRDFWSSDISTFEGKHYTVVPSRMNPKPPAAPPILLGGMAPAALKRAGRIADGWLSPSAADLTHIADTIAVIRSGAEEAGRDPATLRIILRGVVRLGDRGPRLSGSIEQIRADIEWLEAQGVTEVFYDLNWDKQIGNPDVTVESATARAEDLMNALKP
ncbi:TIGR03619 family F420-dependent LLM class oxidoreductase [Actinocrispum sp. NPDC049592]|uniref:TIGR03619 family F420-dependent LLM class oxidoreductase n=1 Tax=Actinocrispum sp. NPDC049592 TaxID=3154835 RepID=UPI003418089F